MGTTTSKGFRAPVNSDAVNIPTDILNLATDVDNYLTTVALLAGPTFTGTVTLPSGTTKIGLTTLTQGGTVTITLPATADTLIGKATTDVLTNKSLSDSTTFVVDNADNTKRLQFDVTGTTGITGILQTAFTTAKTIAFPDTAGTVVVNPMTTAGDIILAGASGVPGRLAIGTNTYVLTSNGTTASWAAPTGGFSNPMTTLGDVIYGGASGTATRLAGSAVNGQYFLTENVTGSASVAPVWQASTGTALSNVVLATTPTITTPKIDTINTTTGAAATPALWGDVTSGSITIGNAIAAGTIQVGGTAVGSSGTLNILTGATTSGTKAINIGTNGSTGSTTTIIIGTTTGTAPTITLNGAITASSTLTISGSTINFNGANPSLVSSATGTLTVFDTALTAVNAFGASVTTRVGYSGTGASSTLNLSTAALTGAFTKTINIGTGGTTGSTTNIAIGTSIGSTTTITGTLTLGTPLTGANGGTGVNNGASTITLGGSLTFSGAFTQSFTATGNTAVTLPTTGTLATLAGSEVFTNKSLSDSTVFFVDVADNTKKVWLDVTGTTGITGILQTAFTTAKTIAFPDTAGTVVVNPMTTAGDIILAGASGVPGRLAIGTNTYVLTSNGTTASWAAPTGGFSNPMTTLGDVIYGGASGTATRLAGSAVNGQYFLTENVTGSASVAPVWQASTGTALSNVVLATTPTITTPKIDTINTTTGAAATPALWGDVTSGSITIGGGILGGTLNLGTGAPGTGVTRTINIGTNGGSTSTTNITIGTPTYTNVTINGNATFSATAIFPAATTGISSLRIPHGTAPSGPTDGDVWTTTAGLYIRINGSVIGPLGASSVDSDQNILSAQVFI